MKKLIAAVAVAASAMVSSPSYGDERSAWLDYVEANANLFVNTGVIAKRGTKVEYTGTYGSPTPSSPNRDILIGASAGGYGGNDNEWGLIRNCNQKISLAYNNATFISTDVEFPPPDDAMLTIVSEVTLDGTGSSISVSGDATGSASGTWNGPNLNYPLYLFARNAAGTADKFSRGRCFGLKIWQVPDGGSEYVLVRDFRPCLYDGEAALYDTVNGMVYKSRSNTPFVPGPVVSDAAPDSFLEYAETQQINGSPYLNTGIVAKRGTKFEYVGTWCKTTCQSAAGATVLGGVSGSTSSTESDYWLGRNVNSWMSASKNCNTDIAFPPDANEVFTIISEFLPNTASADSNFRFIAQSDSHSADMTVAGPNYDTELSMFLFCANGENYRNRDADGKCRSLRIWQVPTGGSEYVLVREFRPCVADGVVGFYDKVSQKVFLPSRGFMLPGPQVKKRGMMIIVK